MIYTLFFSRLRDLSPEDRADYLERVEALRSLAGAEHPGFVDIKSFTAEDGERLSVVRFRDEDSLAGWRRDATHREAQALGRSVFYGRYRIVTCQQLDEHEWEQPGTSPDQAVEGGQPTA
jgi:heme-degrading monooxygenase HmoA